MVAAEAHGLRNRIQSMHFLCCLVVVEKLLGTVNTLSEELQSASVDYLAIEDFMESTKNCLTSFRNPNCWKSIVEEATTLGSQIGLEPSSVQGPSTARSKRAQELCKKLASYFVLSTTGKKDSLPPSVEDPGEPDSEAQSMRTSVLYACVDKFLSELDARFTVNNSVLRSLSAFKPTSPDFLSSGKVADLVRQYPRIGIDTLILESQLCSAKAFIHSLDPPVVSVHQMRSRLMDIRHGFSEVIKLIDLVLTLPVTSVENERFFSSMKRVKTYLRNRCGNERLSDLLVIACLPDEAKNVDTDIVINEFAQMKQRRLPLI